MDHRMAVAAIAFAIAGAVLTSLSAIALGSVKAASKWPSAPKPKIARPIAMIGATLGLILWIGGVGLTVWFAVAPDISTVMRSVYSGIGVGIASAVGIYSCVKVSGKIELRELIELPDRPSSPPPVPVSATRYAQPDDINSSVDLSPQNTAPSLPPGVPEFHPQSPPPSEPQQRPGPFLPDGSQVDVSPPPPPPSPVYNHSQVHQQPGATTWQEAAPTFMPHRSEDVLDQTHAPEPQSPAGPPMPEPTVAEVMHDAEPGWVYTDEHDNYFAAVSQSNGGVGLLSLTDFTVTPAENHPGPLTLVGSVEATVWPMDAEDEPASTQAGSEQTDAADDKEAAQLSGGSPASPATPAVNDDIPGEPERVITPPLNIGKNRQGDKATETTGATESEPPVDSPSTDFEIIEPRSPQPSPAAPEPTQPEDNDPELHEPMPQQTPESENHGERQESTDAINPGFTDYRSK